MNNSHTNPLALCSDAELYETHTRLIGMFIDKWGKPAIEAIVEDYNVKEGETDELAQTAS